MWVRTLLYKLGYQIWMIRTSRHMGNVFESRQNQGAVRKMFFELSPFAGVLVIGFLSSAGINFSK